MSRTKSYTGEYCHQGYIRIGNNRWSEPSAIALDSSKGHFVDEYLVTSSHHDSRAYPRRNPVWWPHKLRDARLVPEQMSGCGVGAGGATREARRVCNLRTRCLHIQLSRSCCCKQKHISTKDQDHQQSPVTITGHHNLRPHHNRLLCMCATDWSIMHVITATKWELFSKLYKTLQLFTTLKESSQLREEQYFSLLTINLEIARHTFTLKDGSRNCLYKQSLEYSAQHLKNHYSLCILLFSIYTYLLKILSSLVWIWSVFIYYLFEIFCDVTLYLLNVKGGIK